MPEQKHASIYQIRLKGQLDRQWATWFEGLNITQTAQGDTCLTGSVLNQAALHGLLRKVRDLGLPLIAVLRLDEPTTPTPTSPPKKESQAPKRQTPNPKNPKPLTPSPSPKTLTITHKWRD